MDATPSPAGTRTRLMEAAFTLVRRHGYAATSVADICVAAGVTKGAFFHHFPSKESLAVAALEHWGATAETLFATSGYRDLGDPLERVLAYVALRREMLEGELAQFTCFAGTLVQEAYADHPAIQAAGGAVIGGHAATLVADIEAAIAAAGLQPGWNAESLALHIQAVLQGAFVLAKALDDPAVARDSLDHLARYVRSLFRDVGTAP